MREFIALPSALHRDDPTWIAPLRMEREAALSPRKNPYFRHAEAAFFLARRDGRPIGRISAQIDRLEAAGTGHFGLLAAEPDARLVEALLAQAEAWLAARGVKRVIGPFNLSVNEESGLLVAGHDTPPMLMMGHDRPHLGAMIEGAGYAKERDLYAYLTDTSGGWPPAMRRILRHGVPGNVRLRPLDMARYRAEIRIATEIFNDAWAGNWGFVPLTEAEMDHMAVQMKPLVRDRLVWFAEMDRVPVGFIVCLPNLNEAIADLGGRLFPFGWAKLLWRLKVAELETARVPLLGIRRDITRSLPGGVLVAQLMEQIRREAVAMGLRKVEMSWVLEDNLAMRRLAEAAGGAPYKTYRLYGKSL
jgi:hypothetical protein